MRVHADPDVCQGHGRCEASAPGVFHLREEDCQSYVLSEEVSPQDEVGVRFAARGYPEQAISVT
jgi:ferredoxin